MDNIASIGINTVYIQVRPNGDSIYPSSLFPMSPYAVGTLGGHADYDPFAVLLQAAQERNLSVHAWINPFRCFREEDRASLSSDLPLLAWCDGDRMVNVGGIWYFNPAYDDNIRYICCGVTEILEHYSVDGIHIDDYFYPTTETSFDARAYTAYQQNGGTATRSDFRRERVTRAVAQLYQTVHAASGNRVFGVSPGGNSQRNYTELYADVAAWCAAQTIDYLCPQVYFGFEHDTCPFEEVCRHFSDMVRQTEVRLIIGMTLGKAYNGYFGISDPYAGSGAAEWIQNRDILFRCLQTAASLPSCSGVAYFSYQFFFSPQNGAPTEATEAERANFLPLLFQIQWK